MYSLPRRSEKLRPILKDFSHKIETPALGGGFSEPRRALYIYRLANMKKKVKQKTQRPDADIEATPVAFGL